MEICQQCCHNRSAGLQDRPSFGRNQGLICSCSKIRQCPLSASFPQCEVMLDDGCTKVPVEQIVSFLLGHEEKVNMEDDMRLSIQKLPIVTETVTQCLLILRLL